MREPPPSAAPAPSFNVPSGMISAGCLAMAAPVVIFLGCLVVSALLALRLHSAAPWTIAGLGLIGAIAFVVSPARMTVEREGLRFAWMGKKRWIPFTDLTRAAVFDRVVEERTRVDDTRIYAMVKVRHVGMTLHLRSAPAINVEMKANRRGRARADELVAAVEQARLAAGGAPVSDP